VGGAIRKGVAYSTRLSYDRFITAPHAIRASGLDVNPPPVLVVDCDAAVRSALSQLLDTVGHPVVQAATGAEALAIARERSPALVVLEVSLPDISGYEICRGLRYEFGEQLPIMFVSALRTESYDRVGGLLIGADDYIVKPFANDEFLARVRRLLARSMPSDQGRGYDLTTREREVLSYLAAGYDQASIAQQLVISQKTIATHIQRILTKLGVHSRAEAVAFAHRNGIAAGRPAG
jgi:DNA-binding NarL/FixJ family response regulator